jgi:hypothetical protein
LDKLAENQAEKIVQILNQGFTKPKVFAFDKASLL